MADKLPAMPFYPGDWFKDQSVAMCATVTRAIWVDLLLSMWTNDRCGQVTGTVAQLAKLARCSEAEMIAAIADLADTKTADVTNCPGKVTITNRRMRREYQTRKDSAKRKAKQRGAVDESHPVTNSHTDVTTPLSSSVSISVSTAVKNTPPTPKGEQRALIDVSDDPDKSKQAAPPTEAELAAWRELAAKWNATGGVRKCTAGNESRRTALRRRLKEKILLDGKPTPWLQAVITALDRHFPLKCYADDPNGWRPEIDWILKPTNVLKVLEGKYDWSKKSDGKRTDGPDYRNGPGQQFDPDAAATSGRTGVRGWGGKPVASGGG